VAGPSLGGLSLTLRPPKQKHGIEFAGVDFENELKEPGRKTRRGFSSSNIHIAGLISQRSIYPPLLLRPETKQEKFKANTTRRKGEGDLEEEASVFCCARGIVEVDVPPGKPFGTVARGGSPAAIPRSKYGPLALCPSEQNPATIGLSEHYHHEK
jgi:hypothetical protein